MPISTRSFSLALVLVLTASLFLTATDARAQSQFVTVNFQGHVTTVYPGANWPATVAVGDTITGFVVYDLTKSSPNTGISAGPLGSTLYDAAVCAGFTAGGISATARYTDPPRLPDFVVLWNDASDGFYTGLYQDKSITTFQPVYTYQIDVFEFGVEASSSDPTVNPSVLTSASMQVVPAVGWDNLYFHWEEDGTSGLGGFIEVRNDQPFQISVVVGAPPACALTYGTNAVARRDFDNDQKAELVVFRPASGNWYVSGATFFGVFQWGLPGDIPMSGDFDGDGKADLAVWRPSNGTWYFLYSSTYGATGNVVQWGLPGDVPVAGDFDGDGKTDLAVWRPSTGTWYIRYSSSGYNPATFGQYQWGLPGDVPVSGDFDGDRKTDLAVWRPSNGTWYIRYSSLAYSPDTFGQYQWGLPGDIPVSGDFDGDGETDLAVFRPSIGGWFLRLSSAGYSVNNFTYYQWGLPADQPLALDFDGDGASDLVVYRPKTGEWYILFSSFDFSTANYGRTQWGLPGDLIPR
jgi:hypothetical protein